jgi:hypothetical protein
VVPLPPVIVAQESWSLRPTSSSMPRAVATNRGAAQQLLIGNTQRRLNGSFRPILLHRVVLQTYQGLTDADSNPGLLTAKYLRPLF